MSFERSAAPSPALNAVPDWQSRVGWNRRKRLPDPKKHGHRYGTDLPEADKRALVEFLKTQ